MSLRIRTSCALLFLCVCSQLAFALHAAPIAGKAWIRVHSDVDLATLHSRLHLPFGAKISHALLLPEQCIYAGKDLAAAMPSASNSQEGTDTKRHSTTSETDIRSLENKLLRCFAVEFDAALSPEEFCKACRNSSSLIAECLPVYANYPLFKPNDPKLGQQAYLDSIEIPAAWNITKGDSTVLIAVVDDGVRRSHQDLVKSVALNRSEVPNNGIDDDHNGYVDDYAGLNYYASTEHVAADATYNTLYDHGTCVASICSATIDNGLGFAGVGGLSRFIPIKASNSSQQQHNIDAGFESILYAVSRGAQVINCSWGNDDQGFNPMQQDIVDYALARGCCIVAACGNRDNFTSPITRFYPAAYRGVLSVGETDASGVVSNNSVYGSHCHIMAPGYSIYTAANTADDSYTDQSAQPFEGTSSATPIVSGVLALVRAHFPQLSAQQCMEHLRVCGTSITTQNPTLSPYVPRMVNARRALEQNPMNSPSIRVLSTSLKDSQGQPILNAQIHDTVSVSFLIHNYLGDASDMKVKLSIVDPNQGSGITVLDAEQSVGTMLAGAETSISGFRVIIDKANSQRLFLRLDFSAKTSQNTDYTDFALVDFYPTQDFVDISDGNAVLSIGDNGWVGSNQYVSVERKGSGFASKRFGNLLYRGGIVCSCDESNGRTGLGSDASQSNNFDFVSRTAPFPYVLRYGDVEQSGDLRLGIQVDNSFSFVEGSIVQCDTKIQNLSFNTLHRFAAGYFLDWDLTAAGDSSFVRVFNEAQSANLSSAAELQTRPGSPAVVGAVAMSLDSFAVGQAGGLNIAFISGNFPPQKMYEALHSGTSIQSQGPDDMSMMVGMSYSNDFLPGQTRKIRFLFGAASSADSLALLMKRAELSTDVVQSDSPTVLYPLPANDMVYVHNGDQSIRAVEIMSMQGQRLLVEEVSQPITGISISCSSLAAGSYLLIAHGEISQRVYKLIVVH